MLKYRQVLYDSYWTTQYGPLNGEDRPETRKHRADSYKRSLGPHLGTSREARVIDLGCGAGFLIKFLLDDGFREVCGIDVSPEQVAICKRERLSVEQAEAIDYLAKNRGWDLIVSTDVIEHLSKDEIVTFLFAIRAALNPGGKVIIRTGNASCVAGPTVRWMDMTHEILFTDRSLTQVLRACGFADVKITDTTAPFGVTPKRFARWAGLKLFRTLLKAAFILEVGEDAPAFYGKFLIVSASPTADNGHHKGTQESTPAAPPIDQLRANPSSPQ